LGKKLNESRARPIHLKICRIIAQGLQGKVFANGLGVLTLLTTGTKRLMRQIFK
jgi:hypothetical protein